MRVAIFNTGFALDPGEVAAGVEDHGIVLFGSTKADGDNVLGGAEGDAVTGRGCHAGERGSRFSWFGCSREGDAVVEILDSVLVLAEETVVVHVLPLADG